MVCGAELCRAGSLVPTAAERDRAEQRRLVTVLFADLSGYTFFAEKLDHDTVKALIERCLARLAVEVDRFGGRADKSSSVTT
jgi:class 3 adenylate cyclase